jgi:tRNA(fMet)-specific endonuclease VapC
MWLLDTDICIFAIRKRSESVFRRLRQAQPGEIGISSITLAELMFGVHKSTWPERNLDALIRFLTPIDVLHFNDHAAFEYGRIRHELQRSGMVIGPYDMLIGAHALAAGRILVTNNTREFTRITGLKVENWASPG